MDSPEKDLDSLEASSDSSKNSVVVSDQPASSGGGEIHAAPGEKSADAPKKKSSSPIKRFLQRFNIYLLLFILVLIISSAVIIVIAVTQRGDKTPKIASQSLSNDTLKQLAKTDATVGDPKQVLSVQSNAVSAGKVLIRDSLDVAGAIHVNGALNLPGITVAGDTVLDEAKINKNLSLGGDAAVLGQLNVKKNLGVSGNGSFAGSLTSGQIVTNKLQMTGDLTLTNHIVAGGSTPGRSNGVAIGAGGTASVSGSDTAGSININTGSGPSVGCFVNVSFSNKYNSTPRIILTPTNSSAAVVEYYVSRTTTGFSLCTAGASAPAANTSFSFDYVVIG